MAVLRALWMGLVLLGVLGALQTQAQDGESVQPNFQQYKFLGRWFTVGLASNSSWFLEKKQKLFVCRTVAALSEDGGLNLTSTFLRKNQCETRNMLLQPADTPGRYEYRSSHWGSTHSVSVVETDYDEFAMLYAKVLKGPDPDLRLATLYSRTHTPRVELKEKFTNFSKAQGFTEDNIIFPPPPEKCLQEQD